MIVFDVPVWQLMQFAVAIILPAVVGLITTRATNSGAKATILLALSVVSSLLTELAAALQTGQVYNLGVALLFALGTFVTGVALHYGLLKPVGVSDKLAGTLRTADAVPGRRGAVEQRSEVRSVDIPSSDVGKLTVDGQTRRENIFPRETE